MTRIVQLTPLAKARVWSGERLTSSFGSEEVMTASCHSSADARRVRDELSAGVEALVPRGARAEYGLLGVTFVPDDIGQVRVEVPYLRTEGERWAEALAAKLDQVRLGLTEQYAPAVLSSLSSAAQGRMPPGVIRVTEAAHGMIGSSPSFFGRLARAVVELLLLDGAEIPDDQLAACIRPIVCG